MTIEEINELKTKGYNIVLMDKSDIKRGEVIVIETINREKMICISSGSAMSSICFQYIIPILVGITSDGVFITRGGFGIYGSNFVRKPTLSEMLKFTTVMKCNNVIFNKKLKKINTI